MFLFGEFSTSVLPVNSLLVFAADKMRAWNSVTRSEPVGDSKPSTMYSIKTSFICKAFGLYSKNNFRVLNSIFFFLAKIESNKHL